MWQLLGSTVGEEQSWVVPHWCHQCEHLLEDLPQDHRTITVSSARLSSVGMLCWKLILHGHPINRLLQEKEQGLGRVGRAELGAGAASSHKQ